MKISQKQKVLKHMKENGKITSLEAFEKYRITRLAAVICELRKAGYQIKSTWCESKTPENGTTYYTSYSLERAVQSWES